MSKALNLSFFLAEYAIRDYYAQTEEQNMEEADLLSYCKEKYSPVYAQRLAYRLLRRRVNHIVVSSVLHDLPQLQREIIVRKFKKHEMSQKISLELNISISQITTIERNIEKNITNMLKYILTKQDVYSRTKVLNMIHILDIRLSFLDEHPELLPDVNKNWLASLRICREKYRRLFSEMADVFQKADTSLHYYVIAERLKNPLLSSKDLSTICHVPQNGINRHLRSYENDVSKYLVA